LRIIRTLALTAAMAMPMAALAEDPATISVTGEGIVQTVPDQATLSLGVTMNGPTAAAAMAANTTAMNTVIARLKTAGIAESDLQTASLYLNPNWGGYDSGQTPAIVDYTASNMLNVRIRDIDQLGAILDAAVADGANAVNGLTFGLADQKPAMDEARSRAVTDARARAEVLATAAGMKLGRLVYISDAGAYPNSSPMFRADMASEQVPVETGELAMTASVMVTWELTP
jgi:uncharacterized protein